MDLAGVARERHAIERHDAAVELGDVAELQEGHGGFSHRAVPCFAFVEVEFNGRYFMSVSDSFMIFTPEMFTPQGGNSFGVKKLSESLAK